MNFERLRSCKKDYRPKFSSVSRYGSFDEKLSKPVLCDHPARASIIQIGTNFYQTFTADFEVRTNGGGFDLVRLVGRSNQFARYLIGKRARAGSDHSRFVNQQERNDYACKAEEVAVSKGLPFFIAADEHEANDEPVDEEPLDGDGLVAFVEELYAVDRIDDIDRIRRAVGRLADDRATIDMVYLKLKQPMAIGVFIDYYLERVPAGCQVDLICSKLTPLAFDYYRHWSSINHHSVFEVSPRTGNTIFISACLLGLTDIVNWYLTNADQRYIRHVNRRGVNGLMAAAGVNNDRLIVRLINHFDLGVQDEQGFTALHHYMAGYDGIRPIDDTLSQAMSEDQRYIVDNIGRTANDLSSE